MSVHAWKKIVKQIEQETHPAKIAELAKKLNDAMIMEARENVKHRLDRYQQVAARHGSFTDAEFSADLDDCSHASH